MIQTKVDNGTVVELPATLDSAAAVELLEAIKQELGTGTSIWLDAAAVETAGLAAIQVLLSAVKSSSSISVINPSAAFVSAFSNVGVFWDHQPAALPAAAPAAEAAENPTERPSTSEAAGPGQNNALAAKRILTIDDSKTMRDMLMLILSNSGFDVLQAVDGQDGINVLERESVDVVITDINMPKMDGYAVLEHLRRQSQYDATPILVLTTESDDEKKERARGLGATGFIVKPFNPTSLIDVIHKVSP